MPVEEKSGGAPGSRKAGIHLSQRYAVLNDVLSTMLAYLSADGNAARLGVSTEQLTALTTFQTDWTTKYNTYKDPATHTRAAVDAVQKAYKEGGTLISEIQQQIKKDKSIEKKADDYKSLSIHVDKTTRTPVPRPTAAPVIVEIKMSHGSNKFRASEATGEGQAHKRLPYQNHLRYRVAHRAPGAEMPADGDYTDIFESGKAEFTVLAPPNTPKATLGYIRVCFVNNKGEAGPECAPYEFVIN